jgi:hypothetical protein
MPAPSQELSNAVEALFGADFTIRRPYSDDHDGVDIKAARGTTLKAIDDGKVSYAQDARTDTEAHSLKHWAMGGGNVVNVDIGGRRTVQYAHLDTIAVKLGDSVERGQRIGTVGSTGNATGPHVHLGLWHHGVGMIEPTLYLAELAGQRLPSPPQVEVAVPIASITVVEGYKPARRFTVPAGTTVRGYDPARPGTIIREVAFTAASGAHAVAQVVIAWPDRDPEPVPHGTFLQVADGAFASLYIKARLVVLDPPEPATGGVPATPPVVPGVEATITVLEQYDPERHFRVPPGTILRGFDPARPGEVVQEAAVADGSGAHASGKVTIAWPRLDPQPIPHGTFLAVSSGAFAGTFIPAQLVVLDPMPEAEPEANV